MNPATGMPDYSAQWAEYYRSIGYIQEAEKIEQQV
jgi:far upstream element-binding protein